PYPLSTGALSPDLPLDSFITPDLFSEVIAESEAHGISHSADIGSAVYANWRIVGFRFDPCAPPPALASANPPADLAGAVPGCVVELRLIAQPVTVRGPGAPTPPFGNDFPS